MRQFRGSNSVYPTSTRHRPSGGAGGAVARLHVASISFIAVHPLVHLQLLPLPRLPQEPEPSGSI